MSLRFSFTFWAIQDDFAFFFELLNELSLCVSVINRFENSFFYDLRHPFGQPSCICQFRFNIRRNWRINYGLLLVESFRSQQKSAQVGWLGRILYLRSYRIPSFVVALLNSGCVSFPELIAKVNRNTELLHDVLSLRFQIRLHKYDAEHGEDNIK